jgi:UDP-N-acetylglucosamine transferase subunit ALG13
MIFSTVGSELPFNRLTQAVDKYAEANPGKEIYAQVGKIEVSDYAPQSLQFSQLLTPSQYADFVNRASVIVAHAGMGSIISSITQKKPVVILPRRGHLQETRNDHQFSTAKQFENREGIFVAWDEEQVAEQIKLALAFSEQGSLDSVSNFANPDLLQKLESFLRS